MVRFEGQIYRNKIKDNAHSPAAYPAGWEPGAPGVYDNIWKIYEG
jgi:hypothetical protein